MKIKCRADANQHGNAEPRAMFKHPAVLFWRAKTNPELATRWKWYGGGSPVDSVWYSGNVGLRWYGVGTSVYFAGVAATARSSRNNGRTEKNLCRQGSHRNDGSRRMRPIIAVTPGTYSAEIRCNARLPQIPQCA